MPISWTTEVPTGTRCAVLHPRARRIPLNVIKTIRNPPPRGSQGRVLTLAIQPHADSPVPATPPCSSHTGPRLFGPGRHAPPSGRWHWLCLRCSSPQTPRGSLGPSGKPFIRSYCVLWPGRCLDRGKTQPLRFLTLPASSRLRAVLLMFWLCCVSVTACFLQLR